MTMYYNDLYFLTLFLLVAQIEPNTRALTKWGLIMGPAGRLVENDGVLWKLGVGVGTG